MSVKEQMKGDLLFAFDVPEEDTRVAQLIDLLIQTKNDFYRLFEIHHENMKNGRPELFFALTKLYEEKHNISINRLEKQPHFPNPY